MDIPDEQMTTRSGRRVLLRIGGVCAILGAVVSVAAGAAVGNVASTYEVEAALRFIAARPQWYWPAGHLAFIAGALLWVAAFVAFVRYTSAGPARVVAGLSAVSAVLGAVVHAIDSTVSGYALAALARAWAGAPAAEQAGLVEAGRLLLWILDGTWAGVLIFFHGLPFVLIGIAVLLDSRQPSWLGWIAALAGLGSIAAGAARLFTLSAFPESLFILFAVIVSIWMVIIGVMMWRRA